jgi:glycosyltransferase involved in cell wall biosynthesis
MSQGSHDLAPRSMTTAAFVYGSQPGDFYRSGRTLRSLHVAGVAATETGEATSERLGAILGQGAPVLLLRAGTWLARTGPIDLPHPSATGIGLCALGAVRVPRESDSDAEATAAAWKALLAETGGNLDHFAAQGEPAAKKLASLPASLLASSIFLDATGVRKIAARGACSLQDILRCALAELRCVHYAALDVYDDCGLRVLQVITALQRGGAERVTLDLLAELPAQNVRVRLATLGRPSRKAFPAPPGTMDLATVPGNAVERGAALVRTATAFGADLVHGHLIKGQDLRGLSTAGLPVVATVHNMRAGWPEGLAALQERDVHLLAACAQAVEAELRAAALPVAVRTVRNGIDLDDFHLTPERIAAGRKWRREWGFRDRDFLLIAVANPRPQKRLHLLPAILAALRARLSSGTEARLVLCGEVMRGNAEAERCVSETREAVVRLGLESHVRWTGPVADIAGILAVADVLVSTSAHEGLSLAQLEALAMGRPVVATDVGGAREIAQGDPRVHLLPADASAEEFAQVLADLVRAGKRPSPVTHAKPLERWSRRHMAERYRWLYPRVIAAARHTRRGEGIWLIANNFSTGGAQSSARRLLLGLAGEGVPVRAAVVEEDPANPTPGRRTLIQAGIPVRAVPALPSQKVEAGVETLLTAIDSDLPQAVLFWNLRPAYKVWLADALLDVPVFDISPGEMFFDSLEAYFAKPSIALPYRSARDYGARLAGVIVKYHAEAQRAGEVLGAPVHVVPNGVPAPNGMHVAADPRTALVIGTAARINPQKRLEDLFEALHLAHERLPAYTLRVAGGVERGCNDYATRLRTLANGLPVQWLGEVADMPGFYRGLDLFAMISEPAGCPNASLEAMGAGLAVIATDKGGASEQVLHSQTGRLVPSRDAKALADALADLAAQPGLRQRLGLAGRNLIRERFSVERMVADYRRICLPAQP